MFIAPKKPRSWGTRFSPLVPSTPTSQSTALGDAFVPASVDVADAQPPQASATPADAEVEPRRAPYGHLPHDASVFVASLPSHLGVPELRQSLLEVFGSYKPVSHVKVIGPDLRGAVCAFVQANNSEDASSLIDRFHMSFFHGRPIRCERARALRALFVSFKLPASPISEIGEHFPRSMRLHRQQNERYVRVLYNEDADSFDADDPVQNASYPSARDPLSCAGAYFSTLKFDMETLRTLCESFGPLEHFEPAVFPDVAPSPHDGPRDPSMYAQVLEVKWSHRNDSVSAFNLFDHLPFIAVSWAHSHPFHPDATPARPPISRFVPRFGGPYIKPAVPTPADVLPTTSEPAMSENAADPSSSASPPQRVTPRFVNATGINAASPFHGITERDFPPLSNRTPRNLDGVWSRPLRITVPSDGLAAANEDEAAAQRDADQDAFSTDSRSATPLLSPTADAPPTPSSPVPVTPLHAEFYQPQPDPTTLFVGGIAIARAPYWDEEQIRAFYARYGQIVDVTFVKPASKPVGFAFVKFASEASTAEAIADHMNRGHDGQQIKVKVKDSGPSYRGWHRGRGRGRGGFRRFMAPKDAAAGGYGLGLGDVHIAEEQENGSSDGQLVSATEHLALIDRPVLEDLPKAGTYTILQRSASLPDIEARFDTKDSESSIDEQSETSSISIHMDHPSFAHYNHMSTPATSVTDTSGSVILPPSTPRPQSIVQPGLQHPHQQHDAPFVSQPHVQPVFYPYPVAPLAYYPQPSAQPRLDNPTSSAPNENWQAHAQGQGQQMAGPWAMALHQPLLTYDQNGVLVPYYPPMYARPPPPPQHGQQALQQVQQQQQQPTNASSSTPSQSGPPMPWPTQLYAPLPPQMWMGMGLLPPNGPTADGSQQQQMAQMQGMPIPPAHFARSQQHAMQQFAAAAAARGVQVNKPLFRPPPAPSTPRQLRTTVGMNVDGSPVAYLPAYGDHSFAAAPPPVQQQQQQPPPPPPAFVPGLSIQQQQMLQQQQQQQQQQGRFMQTAHAQHW